MRGDGRIGRAFRSFGGAACPAASVVALAPPAAAQSRDNKGRDFILMFLENAGMAASTIEVHITGDVQTTATVEYPVNNPTSVQNVPVTPGQITVVSLPGSAGGGWAMGVVDDNAVRVSSPEEIVVYMVNLVPFSSDAALALPIDALNTEYIVTGITGSALLGSPDAGDFGVVAAFDNTTVTITPTLDLLGGFPAQTPFTVTLNRGEGFYARSDLALGIGADPTGSVVRASRPVGMTNGRACTNIPPDVGACDHVFEVAQPVQSWGQGALAANLPNRPSGSVYRVVASQDATTVMLDGALFAILDRGEFSDTAPIPGDHEFAADGPIFVTQFMTGQDSPLAIDGDPAMANLVPPEQFQSAYTFAPVGGAQFASDFVTIVANDADLATITLDGAPIGAAQFRPIGNTGFSSAQIRLTDDRSYTTASDPRNGGHGITVEGFNNFDSYLYPGGALFQFINPVGDANPPLCNLLGVSPSPPSQSWESRDDRPSEDANGNGLLDPGEDRNRNGQIDTDTGIFGVSLAAGASNLDLAVDPFTPGDPVATFSVGPIDPAVDATGSVVVEDGAGNTCTTGPLDFGASLRRLPAWPEAVEIRTAGSTPYAHFVTHDALFIEDVTDPDAPTAVSTFVPATCGGSFFGDDLVLAGSTRTLALVAGGSCGLLLVDVAAPASPTLVARAPLPGWAKSVATVPDRVYVANFSEGLQVIDVSNAADPSLTGTFGPAQQPGFGESIAVATAPGSNDIVYVATTLGLRVIDASQPDPTLMGSFDVADIPGGTDPAVDIPQGISVRNDRAYVPMWQGGLRAFDVTDPANPVPTQMAIPTSSALFKIAIPPSGGMAFLTDGLDGLRVFNISAMGALVDTAQPLDVGPGQGFGSTLFDGNACCYAWDVDVVSVTSSTIRVVVTEGNLSPRGGLYQIFDFPLSDFLTTPDDGTGGRGAGLPAVPPADASPRPARAVPVSEQLNGPRKPLASSDASPLKTDTGGDAAAAPESSPRAPEPRGRRAAGARPAPRTRLAEIAVAPPAGVARASEPDPSGMLESSSVADAAADGHGRPPLAVRHVPESRPSLPGAVNVTPGSSPLSEAAPADERRDALPFAPLVLVGIVLTLTALAWRRRRRARS